MKLATFITILPMVLGITNGKVGKPKTARRIILREHNRYRANVYPPSDSMFELKWNTEGAKKARILARKCNQKFGHDKSTDRRTSTYEKGGQNLYRNTRKVSWIVVTNKWYGEKKYFVYGQVEQNGTVGHYTQLVWGPTKEIGCARHKCKDGHRFVCNYYPPGNSEGEEGRPYQNASTQSCNGCLENVRCSENPEFKGKLMENCDLTCQSKWTNCEDLISRLGCNSKYKQDCSTYCYISCPLYNRY